MAFDPDAYLATPVAPAAPPPAFDPDAYLRATAPAAAPAPVATAAPAPAPAPVGALTGLGRGLASTADVVAGIVPATIQQVSYPFLRLGMSAVEAQRRAQAAAAPFEQPVGRLFGVTETPEYKESEASRRLMNFIGENVEKGADWISQQTGIPKPDVENMIGTGLFATPALKGVRTPEFVRQGAVRTVEDIGTAIKKPFQPTEFQRIQASEAAYKKGPQIDAAAAAQRLGIAINPMDIQPTVGPKVSTMWAGERGKTLIQEGNRYAVNDVARADLGLQTSDALNGPAAFDKARAQVAKPYDEVAALPKMTASVESLAELEKLRPDPGLIGKEAAARRVNKQIDSAIGQMSEGLTGKQLLDNIRSLRRDAKTTYKRPDAKPVEIEMADTNMAIASQLERMIENNIADPNLLSRFQDARTQMAKTYAYEGATDFTTGFVDPNALARMMRKDTLMTGDMADLARIAGNFPDVFTARAGRAWPTAEGLGRTGPMGSAGGVIGYGAGGYPGAVIGGTGASVLSTMLGRERMARKIASPEYQRGLVLNDPRIRVPEAAPPPMAPIPQERAIVPYQTPQELLMPGQGPYNPNFIFVNPPEVTPSMPAGGPRALPAPSAQATMNALRVEEARRNAMSRALGQEAEAAARSAEVAAPRQSAGAGTLLELDPTTGRLRPVDQGVKGATPETFSNYGAALESATNKLASGQRFAFTAEERIAWNKTKADIAQVEPGLNKLSDKAIAEKMMDREWVNQSIKKAREQAAAFEQIAERAKQTQARQNALAQRDRLMDLADQLNESLRAPRPVSSGQQGPKTRAAKRNALSPDQNNNLLAP